MGNMNLNGLWIYDFWLLHKPLGFNFILKFTKPCRNALWITCNLNNDCQILTEYNVSQMFLFFEMFH